MTGATKDLNKLMDEKKEVDPKLAEAERERLAALEEQENERKSKFINMEREREIERQRIRDKVYIQVNKILTERPVLVRVSELARPTIERLRVRT